MIKKKAYSFEYIFTVGIIIAALVIGLIIIIPSPSSPPPNILCLKGVQYWSFKTRIAPKYSPGNSLPDVCPIEGEQ